MSLKNKVVVVTGGAGFIGSHIVEESLRQFPEKVVIIDCYMHGRHTKNLGDLYHPFGCDNSYIVVEDASNFRSMKRIFMELHPDVVFDLAVAPLPASLEYPIETFRTNVDLGVTMCELARAGLFDTLIHFSSSEVYGTCVRAPMDEHHPLNGRTTYAASKTAVDQLFLSYNRTFGMDVSVIRPFNVYGPRQNMGSYAAVIPITIKRILSGKPPIINGDGRQTRDYTYVTDIANAAIKFYDCANTRGKVINVASGNEIEISTLINKISDIMGCNKEALYQSYRPGDVRRHIADITLAKETIGYSPLVDLESGLLKTVEWYRSGYE